MLLISNIDLTYVGLHSKILTISYIPVLGLGLLFTVIVCRSKLRAASAYEKLYSPSKHGRQQEHIMQRNNNYYTDNSSKLNSNLTARLAHNTLDLLTIVDSF